MLGGTYNFDDIQCNAIMNEPLVACFNLSVSIQTNENQK